MGAHVAWDDDKDKAPVWIEIGNSADEILKDGYLSAELKSRLIKTLGILFDADTKPAGRYQRVFNLCGPFFPGFPNALPKDGLVIENAADQKRFGVWIMPDNAAEGDLEMFLRYLVLMLQNPHGNWPWNP